MNEEKEEMFLDELSYIKNDDYADALLNIINMLPEYWFHEPASSTGKYHPEYALGDGGLLRHSKAAMRIGFDLLENPAIGGKYTAREKDLMLMSLLVHDGLKLGINQEKYTRFDHPILMGNFIIDSKDEIGLNEEDAKFMNDVITNVMVTPLTKLTQICPVCGEEVTSPVRFPNGTSALFNISSKYSKFGKK